MQYEQLLSQIEPLSPELNPSHKTQVQLQSSQSFPHHLSIKPPTKLVPIPIQYQPNLISLRSISASDLHVLSLVLGFTRYESSAWFFQGFVGLMHDTSQV